MKKTDKKIDNAICAGLTQLCEEQLKQATGFQWLTHTVNYKQFPSSLQVICIFDSEANLAAADQAQLRRLIQQQLSQLGITIASQQISFDTEDQCEQQHAGNWKKRLK